MEVPAEPVEAPVIAHDPAPEPIEEQAPVETTTADAEPEAPFAEIDASVEVPAEPIEAPVIAHDPAPEPIEEQAPVETITADVEPEAPFAEIDASVEVPAEPIEAPVIAHDPAPEPIEEQAPVETTTADAESEAPFAEIDASVEVPAERIEAPVIAHDPAPEPIEEQAPVETTTADAEPEAPFAENDASVEVPAERIEAPVIAHADATPDVRADEDKYEDPTPGLFQATLPNLTVLSPEFIGMRMSARPEVDSAPVSPIRPLLGSAPEPTARKYNTPVTVNSELPDLSIDYDVETTREKPAEDDGIPTLSFSMRIERPIIETPAEVPPVETAITEPERVPEAEPEPVATADEFEITAYDLDPPLAELQPDLDVLEHEMANTHDKGTEPGTDSKDEDAAVADAASVSPEITLDRAIQDKIDEATELLERTNFDLAEVAATEEAKTAAIMPEAAANSQTTDEGNESGAELHRISTEVATLESIEGMDEEMGETLFGSDFSQTSAHVVANPLPDESANDDSRFTAKKFDITDVPSPDIGAENPFEEIDKPVITRGNGHADNIVAATDRLVTAGSLDSVGAPNGNSDHEAQSAESAPSPEERVVKPTPTDGESAESTEDPISASMSQTLNALNARPPTIDDDDDGNAKRKGGFFSRFRRS